ncbi:iron-hydroxamate transporter permease subunit [Actinobacillus equuli]|nr:iron-hydroxamate transporter permease subunit [Actinobacillus equuli]
MVKASKLLFSGLAVLFFGLLLTVLMLQLPDGSGFVSLFLPSENLELLLIQSYSLPRIVMALLAGGILGLASLLLQQVMANPLASDNTLGISSGAQFALF